jgi:hypothetical protein
MSTVTLSWTPPTTYTDGSNLPASDIARTDIYNGTTKMGESTTEGAFTTDVLDVGTYNFTAVTVAVDGGQSDPSNMVTVTINAVTKVPSPITNLTAKVNP